MLCWQHVNSDFFHLVLILEICYYRLWTQPNRFARSVFSPWILPTRWYRVLDIHFFRTTLYLLCDSISLLLHNVRTSRITSCTGSETATTLAEHILPMMPTLSVVMYDNILPNLIREAFEQRRHRVEYLIQIQTQYFICRYIGQYLIKPTMNVDIMIDHKTSMSKPLNIIQPIPIRRISIINIKR